MKLDCRSIVLDLREPVVMGVLNVTPDSFSDGGTYSDPDTALDRAMAMIDEGAGIVDVGGESTRPRAAAVGAAEEIDRVVPVIEKIASRSPVPVSVDTSKPAVMAAAVAAGARMINDVRALQLPGAVEVAAASGAGICLMHMRGEPGNMQSDPQYGDVVAEVADFLRSRVTACNAAGIARERICIDPGIGFGKRPEHNLLLLANLHALSNSGIPVLVGVSRKSLVGMITGRPLDQRLAGSVAFAALAVDRGASILRAHDVAATVDALKVARALHGAAAGGRQR